MVQGTNCLIVLIKLLEILDRGGDAMPVEFREDSISVTQSIETKAVSQTTPNFRHLRKSPGFWRIIGTS